MTQPSGENGPTALEALNQVSPEIAWVHQDFEGLLMVSRLACEAYGGLKPVVEVELPTEADTEDKTEIVEGVPRMNITVVGPAEIQQVAGLIHPGVPPERQAVYGSADEGRIDLVAGFDIAEGATAQEQLAFFEDAYGEVWPDVQRRNTSDSFAYSMAHLIPDLLGGHIGDAVTQYRRQQGLDVSSALIGRYQSRVTNRIHEVFCPEEHLPPDWEVPDAI